MAKYGKAFIQRKAADIHELEMYFDPSETRGTDFVIEKEIELDGEKWEAFSENFFDGPDWLSANIERMFVDTNDIWHCLYIKREGADFGVLVESEGYDYARYTALIRDADIKISQ